MRLGENSPYRVLSSKATPGQTSLLPLGVKVDGALKHL